MSIRNMQRFMMMFITIIVIEKFLPKMGFVPQRKNLGA